MQEKVSGVLEVVDIPKKQTRMRTRSMDTADQSKSDATTGDDKSGNPPVGKFRICAKTQALLAAKGISHLFPIQSL